MYTLLSSASVHRTLQIAFRWGTTQPIPSTAEQLCSLSLMLSSAPRTDWSQEKKHETDICGHRGNHIPDIPAVELSSRWTFMIYLAERLSNKRILNSRFRFSPQITYLSYLGYWYKSCPSQTDPPILQRGRPHTRTLA